LKFFIFLKCSKKNGQISKLFKSEKRIKIEIMKVESVHLPMPKYAGNTGVKRAFHPTPLVPKYLEP
jgi:hypothetical protein